jgi:hypothetical protein
MNVSPLIAADAYYFFLDEKVTKTKRSDLMNATKKRKVIGE